MSSSASTSSSPSSRPRGAFILLEGLDRSGKSSQCVSLGEWLNNKYTTSYQQTHQTKENAAVNMRFPDRTTEIGKMIDAYLRNSIDTDDHVIHLLFAANRWESSHVMRQHLEKGQHLIVDRYSYSGIAFSSAKAGLDLDWCQSPEKGLLAPDIVLFLDVDAEVQQKRGQFGQERYENVDMQERVRQRFKQLRLQARTWEDVKQNKKDEQENGSMGSKVAWHLVNANGTMEEVAAELQKVAEEVIEHVKDKPLTFL